MPLFRWVCCDCGEKGRAILDARPKLNPCSKCGGKQKFASLVDNSLKEVIDNGIMAKSIERLRNIEELVDQKASDFAERDDDGNFV